MLFHMSTFSVIQMRPVLLCLSEYDVIRDSVIHSQKNCIKSIYSQKLLRCFKVIIMISSRAKEWGRSFLLTTGLKRLVLIQ